MNSITITLDTPVKRIDSEVSSVTLRVPNSGEMRGINLIDLATMKTDTLIKVIPRIVSPTLSEAEVAGLCLADFMAMGAEIAGFLLKTSDHPDFPAK